MVSFRCSCLGKINLRLIELLLMSLALLFQATRGLGKLSREAPLGEDVAKGADTWVLEAVVEAPHRLGEKTVAWLGTDTLVRADGGREDDGSPPAECD